MSDDAEDDLDAPGHPMASFGDHHDRSVDYRDAWDSLHRWLAYYRGATIAADAVLARMDLLIAGHRVQRHGGGLPTGEVDR